MLCCIELAFRFFCYIIFTLLCGALGITQTGDKNDGPRKKTTDILNILALFGICFIFALLLPKATSIITVYGCRTYGRFKNFLFPTIKSCNGIEEKLNDVLYTKETLDRLSVTFALASCLFIILGVLACVLNCCNWLALLMNQVSKCAILVPLLLSIAKIYLAVNLSGESADFWSSAINFSKWYLFSMYVGFDAFSLAFTILVLLNITNHCENLTKFFLTDHEKQCLNSVLIVHVFHVLSLILSIVLIVFLTMKAEEDHKYVMWFFTILELVIFLVIVFAFVFKWRKNRNRNNDEKKDCGKEHSALMAYILSLFLTVSHVVSHMPHLKSEPDQMRWLEFVKLLLIILHTLSVALYTMLKMRCADDEDDKTHENTAKEIKTKEFCSKKKVCSHSNYFFILALFFGNVFFVTMRTNLETDKISPISPEKNATNYESLPTDATLQDANIRKTADKHVVKAFDYAFYGCFALKTFIIIIGVIVSLIEIAKQYYPKEKIRNYVLLDDTAEGPNLSEFTMDSKFVSEFLKGSS